MPTQGFLFFAYRTFFKTIADPHCTHCQSPTACPDSSGSLRYNQSFVKACNFATAPKTDFCVNNSKLAVSNFIKRQNEFN